MSVICFASLKGGVGKTSLSINISAAFAQRQCQTLLIDCDPTAHTSRFFKPPHSNEFLIESPLAKLFLSKEAREQGLSAQELIDKVLSYSEPVIRPVRPHLDLIEASADFRHFLWGRGARTYRNFFPAMIEEMKNSYDHIIIDTPPDFNVLTRNAIAVADLVVVPVDSSQMSIHCLEEIIACSDHIKKPTWAIIRTMVTKKASRMHKLSQLKIQQTLEGSKEGRLYSKLNSDQTFSDQEAEEINDHDIESAPHFISMLQKHENGNSNGHGDLSVNSKVNVDQESPIFLLNSLIYRTEQQNRLSFIGKTAFENKEAAQLAEQYLSLARELEEFLVMLSPPEFDTNPESFLSSNWR